MLTFKTHPQAFGLLEDFSENSSLNSSLCLAQLELVWSHKKSYLWFLFTICVLSCVCIYVRLCICPRWARKVFDFAIIRRSTSRTWQMMLMGPNWSVKRVDRLNLAERKWDMKAWVGLKKRHSYPSGLCSTDWFLFKYNREQQGLDASASTIWWIFGCFLLGALSPVPGRHTPCRLQVPIRGELHLFLKK